MNRILITTFLILFLTATVLICVFKPKTHKPIMFENKNFELSLITEKSESEKKEVKVDFPYIEMPEVPSVNINLPQIQDQQTKSSNYQINKQQQEPTKANKQKTSVNEKKENKVQSTQNQEVKKQETTTQKTQTQPVKKEQTKVKKEPENEKSVQKQENKVTEEKKEKPKPQTQQEPKPQTQTKQTPVHSTATSNVKVLTEEEEIIAWNKWRSDLQNKLMRDSKIYAPVGTSFMFSFTVDKNGNMSNLRTWSSNPSYNSVAVNIIKPILLGYQKTAILNFPAGSKRIITNVSGGFTMANSTRYSSPSDYNDYERVIR